MLTSPPLCTSTVTNTSMNRQDIVIATSLPSHTFNILTVLQTNTNVHNQFTWIHCKKSMFVWRLSLIPAASQPSALSQTQSPKRHGDLIEFVMKIVLLTGAGYLPTNPSKQHKRKAQTCSRPRLSKPSTSQIVHKQAHRNPTRSDLMQLDLEFLLNKYKLNERSCYALGYRYLYKFNVYWAKYVSIFEVTLGTDSNFHYLFSCVQICAILCIVSFLQFCECMHHILSHLKGYLVKR